MEWKIPQKATFKKGVVPCSNTVITSQDVSMLMGIMMVVETI